MKKHLNGTTVPFEIGDFVVHIPHHLLIGSKSEQIRIENLGIVKSKNENTVFVRYHGGDTAASTNPKELFRIDYRSDLIELTRDKLEGGHWKLGVIK